MILEVFADKPEESIVKGRISVGNWSSAKGVEINVTAHPLQKYHYRCSNLALAHS